jgi:hypothetical protein
MRVEINLVTPYKTVAKEKERKRMKVSLRLSKSDTRAKEVDEFSPLVSAKSISPETLLRIEQILFGEERGNEEK